MKKIMTLALVLAAAGCSSKKKGGEEISAEQKEKNQPTKAGKAANWDYEKVRQVRQLEAEESAKNPTADKGASCQVMSKSQMIRAGLSGCTPVDARSGMGEGNYCCPRE